jgi:hypothetical protein
MECTGTFLPKRVEDAASFSTVAGKESTVNCRHATIIALFPTDSRRASAAEGAWGARAGGVALGEGWFTRTTASRQRVTGGTYVAFRS